MHLRGWRWRLAAVVALILLIAGVFFSGVLQILSWENIRASLDGWQATARRNPVAAILLFALVYIGVTALSLPAAGVLTLLSGALFGRWVGALVSSIAATCGATLAFLTSRYLLRDWVHQRFGERLRAIDEGIQRDGAYYLFTLRLIPLVPFFLLNLAAGLTSMRTVTFAFVSWLGMLPGGFLYANVGTELGTLESPSGLLSWPMLGSLALLGLVPLVIRRLVRG